MSEKEVTFREAIHEAFDEELKENPRLFLMGEDIVYKRQSVLGSLKKKFPKQIINNLPLLEDMIVGIGVGMSIGGLNPVINFNYDTHMTLAMDDIYRLGIWRYRMSEKDGPGVVVRFAHEGFTGKGPEFSASLLALLFHMPNIWIATPGTPYHAKGLLKTAFRSNRPVVFWEHKKLYETAGIVPEKDYVVTFPASSVLTAGKHVTIIAWSYMVNFAFAAASRVKLQGIEAEVISLHTLNPMDMSTILTSARKTKRIIIVEEDILRGGIGAEIAARIGEEIPSVRIKRIASKNVALPGHAPLEKRVLPSEEDIISACREFFNANPSLFFFFR